MTGLLSLISQGKITAKQLVVNEIAPETKSLWQHKPCPFVYCYDKIAGVDMCIDARYMQNSLMMS